MEITTSAGGSGTLREPADDPRRHAEPLRGVAQRTGPGRVAHEHRRCGLAELAQRRQRGLRGAARADDHRALDRGHPDGPQGLLDPDDVGVRREPARRSRRTRVFAAPMAAVSAATSSATSSATRLSGIVSDSPTHSGPRPATNPGRPASSTAYRP